MEDYNDKTAIELHTMLLKINKEHEQLKSDIGLLLDEVVSIEDKINEKGKLLEEKEETYVKLMEAFLKKKENEPV